MYSLFIGLTFLQQFRPYFRKYISSTLEAHEYVLLNTVLILVLLLMYVMYLLCMRKTTLSKLKKNVLSLSTGERICLLVMALLTVLAGLLIFELDKNYNTPLMNSMYLKALSTIALLVVGVLIFKEYYNIHQVLGVVLILLGIYITSIKHEIK